MTEDRVPADEKERATFRLEVPELYNFARDVIGKWAQDPAKRAMLWVDERGERRELTFRHFAQRSSALADGLRQLGVRRGDRVVVVVAPEPAWWEIFMALLKLGAIAVPGTSQLTGRDIGSLLTAVMRLHRGRCLVPARANQATAATLVVEVAWTTLSSSATA